MQDIPTSDSFPPETQQNPTSATDGEICADCWKDKRLCICDEVAPVKVRTELLVLQHPREAANPAGTARLATLNLDPATHRIGLSWRSFEHALGRKADPKRWAVLYLGTQKASQLKQFDGALAVLNAKGEPTAPKGLQGLVLLDGNWKQSKTLWWRNPWLLKLQRVVLKPSHRSVYHEYRRQPRKECLSTIEAAADCLQALGDNPEAPKQLNEVLSTFLKKWHLLTSASADEAAS